MVEKQLQHIRLETKANIYFDGRVTSRTCYNEDGTRFTLGIITAGSYVFEVGDREVVHLISGDVEVLRPGDKDWVRFAAPETFEIVANCHYQIRTTGVVEYLCNYYKD